jgi:hypothetical protein
MATAGGPLRRRHGIIAYSAQTVQGTAVLPATDVGLCTPRAMRASGMANIFSIGTPNALWHRAGMAMGRATVSIDELQEKTFLLQALRTAGVLPFFTLGIGYVDDAGTKYAWQIQDCKIGSLTGECAAGGPVKLDFDITGGLITELTTLAWPTRITQKPFRWYEGVVTKAAAAYEMRRLRFNVNHNLRADGVLYGTAPSVFKRGWKYLTEGDEVISLDVDAFAKSGIDLHADTVADATNVILALTDIGGGGNAATLAFTGCGPETETLTPADEFLFSLPWFAKTWLVS